MRSIIFGAGGMLGSALAEELQRRDRPVTALDHAAADIAERGEVESAVREARPRVLYNCAAFTRVDECEERQELALEVNGRAVANLAGAARRERALLVQVSTDYVFDGCARSPYDEAAEPRPVSTYGRTKLVGEHEAQRAPEALVVRTSWLFGEHGPSFVSTILRLLGGDEPVRVVDDQVGCPTYAPFLARALVDLAERGARGIVHYRNRDPVSWHGFARAIAGLAAPEREVIPASTVQLPRPAARPPYSVLAVDRFQDFTGREVECWRPGLEACITSLLRERGGA